MTFEFPNSAFLKGCLNNRAGRIGRNKISSFLKFQRPFNSANLDFTTDTLGALSPLQLNGLKAMFFHNIFRNSQAGVFHIHLNQDFTIPLMKTLVNFNTSVHIRRFGDFSLCVQFKLGIDTAYILSADQRHATDGGAYCKMLPVLSGNFSRSECTGENRCFHLDFNVPAVFCFGIDSRKDSGIRTDNDTRRKPCGTHGIALNVQM